MIAVDAANTNHFYGEKLKQTVYEPDPGDMSISVHTVELSWVQKE